LDRFFSSNKICPNNNDSILIDAIKSSDLFALSLDNVISLRNSIGSVNVILTPYVAVPVSSRVLFEGNYSTNNPKIPNFRV
jgi:hypothetical protein